ncbi:MAG TPA: DinB family protein [Alphaproteobacteria bacterium]|nr:DinB family protein [Alphaproteobacteria bacterium]
MSEVQRIAEELRQAFEGPAWHGPAVRTLLADVSAERAAARPLANAHSIWEIALHIAAWEDVVRRRLAGEVIVDVPDDQDWPPVRVTTAEAWQRTLHHLEQTNRALREAIAKFDDARLADRVPGKGHSVYVMLHGLIQHDLYHAGQIALLRKA